VANVFDAMKKSQAEQAGQTPPAEAAAAAVISQAASGTAAEAAAPAASPVQALLREGTQPSPPELLPVATGGNGYSLALTVHHDRGGPITEQYRALRTSLLSQYADERFCLVVTSAERGEGKSVTCLNLAMVLAERPERRTVVVDGDLRQRQIALLLNMPNTPGLADLLRGQRKIPDVVQGTAYPNLFVIPAGQPDADEVALLLGRPDIGEVIAELRQRYDYVLVDAPPVNVVADAAMLSRAVGEALVVMRLDKTHIDSTERAIRLLKAANVKVAGMVLTHQKFHIPNYLYRYS
jgi:protein-tyrosine kinase